MPVGLPSAAPLPPPPKLTMRHIVGRAELGIKQLGPFSWGAFGPSAVPRDRSAWHSLCGATFASRLPSDGELTREPRITSLARTNVATCRLGQRIGELHPIDDMCVVINEEGVVLGAVRGKALREDPDSVVDDVMDPSPSTYRP